MADKETKKEPDASKPRFDPKPVQVGGESLIDRLLPHVKKIAISIGVIIVIVGVVMMVVWFRDRKSEKETDKISSVLDVASKPIEPPTPQVGSGSAAAKKPEGFTSAKDRATATLDAIAKSGADAPAAFKGSLLVQAGKLDDAIAEFRRGQGQTGLDGVLAREGLGIALEAKAEEQKDPSARQKGLEDALAAFQSMQPDEQGPRRGYALYHQGRILAMLGKKADAKAAFEKAKAAGKDAELVDMVDERLSSLGAS